MRSMRRACIHDEDASVSVRVGEIENARPQSLTSQAAFPSFLPREEISGRTLHALSDSFDGVSTCL